VVAASRLSFEHAPARLTEATRRVSTTATAAKPDSRDDAGSRARASKEGVTPPE
jgi:hypothetical protein